MEKLIGIALNYLKRLYKAASSPTDNHMTGVLSAVIMGCAGAVIYFSLTWCRIEGQGLYYDELFQAPASFSMIGLKQPSFSMSFGIVPVLNTTYNGAIKSGLYGAYLRLSGHRFSVRSWRALGICFLMAGIIIFALLARKGMSPFEMVFFLVFLLSDVTILLATRHDWGPVALALFLRLVFLGVVFNARTRLSVGARNTAGLGVIAGFSIFEKLSSIVMLAALACIIFFDGRRHAKRHYWALATGFCAGISPLVAANIGSFIKYGTIVSLSNTADPAFVPHRTLGYFIWGILSQGNGKLIEDFILGTSGPIPPVMEIIVLSAILSFIMIHGFRIWQKTGTVRLWAVMAACYSGIAVTLLLLPRSTWVHHWVIATPFQYAALSLWIVEVFRERFTNARFKILFQTARFVSMGAVLVLLGMHLVSVYFAERALRSGNASSKWDISLTHLADFAVHHSSHAAFIASDWGVGIQIQCMGNGRRDLMYEPFWEYHGRSDLEKIVQQSAKDVFYVVSLASDSLEGGLSKNAVWKDADSLSVWRSVPVERETGTFKAIRMKKYERVRIAAGKTGGFF